MTRIRRAALAAVLTLVLPLPIIGAGTAFAAPGPSATAPSAAPATASDSSGVQLELPRPTGPHAIGRSTLHLVDQHRRDPWVPAAGARELMVSTYYPARPGTGGPAPYMTTEEARLLLQQAAQGGAVPAEALGGTRTYAHADARPERGRFPLLVLSPGLGLPRATLTGLAEDLASRGYVVALVDHTYESTGVTFPDGRTRTCAVCDQTPTLDALEAIARSRATDLSFVVDQLTDRHSPWRYAGMIDPRRIGMAGHSIGGNAAAATMAVDDRVRAGVNMDGTFLAPVPATGLQGRPFLMFGTLANHSPGGADTSWDRDWARLDGWKRWLTIAGSDHSSFTDLPVLAAQLGVAGPVVPIPAQRAEEITRAYVGAFFDLHLRGIPQPLLDGPSPADPEVAFQHP
ncbi:alpha/beta hydrolase family protein [Kitasatospora sp. NPDC059812]|uniref:alpha/beta hydrolase family protein n=1 Tax=Kitasatospora sp. NPDC059812 TaxID=3346958 RepID=UPI003656F719